MLNKKMVDALNAQINKEYWSAYFYLSMSANFAHKGLEGFASWFEMQFKEEQLHAEMFVKYILSRNEKIELKPIAEVRQSWDTLLDAFEDTLKHEQAVTLSINELYSLAGKEKDYATQSFLKTFIDEQIEEEETVQLLIDKLKLIGDNGLGIYMLDKEVATRKTMAAK
ncbi:MAG: ferritin [Bacteroidales bacterium]